MTTVQQIKAAHVSTRTSAVLPHVALCLAGSLLIFGAAVWLFGQAHMAGHVLIITGAVIAPFSGLALVRHATRTSQSDR